MNSMDIGAALLARAVWWGMGAAMLVVGWAIWSRAVEAESNSNVRATRQGDRPAR